MAAPAAFAASVAALPRGTSLASLETAAGPPPSALQQPATSSNSSLSGGPRGPPLVRAQQWRSSRGRTSQRASSSGPPVRTSSGLRSSQRAFVASEGIELVRYSGVVLTGLLLLPALLGSHLLWPEVVSLPVLLLPAGTALSQALTVPTASGCWCCHWPLRRRSFCRCMRSPAARLKALVSLATVAPFIFLVFFLSRVYWGAHLSLLPAAACGVILWPRHSLLWILGGQLHLEIILSNTYTFRAPYAVPSPGAGFSRRSCLLRPTQLLNSLFMLCLLWAIGDILLIVNLFYVHLPVSPLPTDLDELKSLLPLSTTAEIATYLERERRLLAAIAFLFAACGFFLILMLLQWGNIPFGLPTGSLVPSQEAWDDTQQRLAREARRVLQEEHNAKMELVKACMNVENVEQGSPLVLLGCSICQEMLQEGDAAVRLPECRHAFHRTCLFQWFERRLTCPNCKKDIHSVLAGQGLVSTRLTNDCNLSPVGSLRRPTADAIEMPYAPSIAATAQAIAAHSAGEAFGAGPGTPSANVAAGVSVAAENRQAAPQAVDAIADTSDGWLDIELGPRTVGASP
ncbi:ring u-box domain-containing protein [Cyclospora cayetanensis]|uniref:Ring u-box domain-containing protein n=1 Tax=Cyclospora cayetanensis TaxID=88456 RepID=A0A1D3D3M3_9EIME|nr:ring u-box domain-containing protein [Cyclospora cayetanensis]